MSQVLLRLVLSCLLLVLSPALVAQIQTAEINGEVRDGSNAAVANAKVTATNTLTKVARVTSTNGAGKYQLPSLTPGSYDVEVEAKGFQRSVAKFLKTDVNQSATVDFELKVGQVSDTVTVSAEGSQIDTTTAQVGTVVTQEKINELPLNGRNFTQLLTLTPGATPVSTGQNKGGAQVQQVGTFVFPSVNGQQNRSNSYLLDGIVNNGHYMGTYMIPPNVDSIAEFKVQSSSAQAEFGGVTGGTVNVATKSGTNALHGSLYEFLRNDALDARGFFTGIKPALRQHQFGATVGGPVLRNRTFFFAAYEGYRRNSPASSLTIVPTPQELSGDFSQNPRRIYDPYSTRVDPANANRFLRDPFPGNIIPGSRINPSTAAWAKAILPAPEATGFAPYNHRDTDPSKTPVDQFSGRVDHQFDRNDFGFFRASWGPQDGVAPQSIRNIYTKVNIQVLNLGGSFTRIIGPGTVVNGLFGMSNLERSDKPFLTSQTLLEKGFFSGLPYNSEVTAPGITLPNEFSVTTRNRIWGPMRQWQARGDISHVAGKHSLKVGLEWIRNPWRYSAVDGSLTFATSQTADPNNLGGTGIDTASFVLGVHDQTNYLKNDLHVVSSTWGMFVQDSWRLTPRLTVNFGLRWDILDTPHFTQEFPSLWDINKGIFLVGINQPPTCGSSAPPPCLVDPNDPYIKNYVRFTGSTKMRPNDYAMIGPRLGVAYKITPKLVARGFYGIFYDTISGVNQQAQNADGWPNVTGNTLTSLNRSTVQYTATSPFGGSTSVPDPTPVRQTQYLYDPYRKQPRSMQWHLQVETQLPFANQLTVGYVGSHSTRLNVSADFNAATTPGPGPLAPRQIFSYMPVLSPFDRSIGQGWYDGLQVKLERRFAQGFSYLLGYTWSKSIDYSSSGQFAAEDQSLQAQYNPRESKSVSGYDIPHSFSLAGIYQFPVGPGKRYLSHGLASKLVANWQLNSILQLRSGQPFTPVMNVDSANIGAGTAQTRVRPDLVGNPSLANPSPTLWFNTTAFAAPAAYRYGTAGRNILRSASSQNLDLSLFRDQRIKERFGIQFRAEAFNLANHPVFALPQVLFTSAQFGRVSSTVSQSRQIQLGLRVSF